MSEQPKSNVSGMPSRIRKLTNTIELLGELNGGVFLEQLDRFLTDIPLAVTTTGKKGSVSVTFEFQRVGSSGTQVSCVHTLKALQPTSRGKLVEDGKTDTPLHVSGSGRLSIFPEQQQELLER